MKNVFQRVLFVLLTTATMGFFSEKVYWYPQGYTLFELLLFYAFPVFACLWAIEHFHVRNLSGIMLVAALFAFLVEGVLTPVIYEAGLFDPVMPAYFIGWHGLLSVVFGWYLVRKWLEEGTWKKIFIGGTLIGLFWGTWSITFWLPENIAEWEQAAAAGEAVIPGIWPVSDYGIHSVAFTMIFIFTHWLLGRGIWQKTFQPSKAEKWIVLIGLVFFFSTMVFPVLPLAIFKLIFLLGLVFLGLFINRGRYSGDSILSELSGPVKFCHTLTLLAMPIAATLVYGSAVALSPTEDFLRLILEMTPLLQGLIGAIFFVWALFKTLWPRRKQILAETLLD